MEHLSIYQNCSENMIYVREHRNTLKGIIYWYLRELRIDEGE